jgi:hypothetical protein
MGTSHLSFDMDVVGDVQTSRPLSESALSIFESLRELFGPRDLRGMVNDGATFRLKRQAADRKYGEALLWSDEQVLADQVLTRCSGGGAPDLISELRDLLSSQSVESLFLSAEGPLWHHPAGMEIAWYGRWKSTTPQALTELATVQFQWTTDERAFRFILPLEGYPLTSTQLLATGFVTHGDSAAAASNRAAIIPVLGHVPTCLGLEPKDVRWTIGGDWEYRYAQDAREIREVWLRRLRGG